MVDDTNISGREDRVDIDLSTLLVIFSERMVNGVLRIYCIPV